MSSQSGGGEDILLERRGPMHGCVKQDPRTLGCVSLPKPSGVEGDVEYGNQAFILHVSSRIPSRYASFARSDGVSSWQSYELQREKRRYSGVNMQGEGLAIIFDTTSKCPWLESAHTVE